MIIATSKDMKGASNLLEDHQDKYALTPCGSKKWYLVIQLSEDVRLHLRLACPCPGLAPPVHALTDFTACTSDQTGAACHFQL